MSVVWHGSMKASQPKPDVGWLQDSQNLHYKEDTLSPKLYMNSVTKWSRKSWVNNEVASLGFLAKRARMMYLGFKGQAYQGLEL